MSEATHATTGAQKKTTEPLPSDATRLGVDKTGYEIHFSRIHTSIYVTDEHGTIVYTRDDITPGPALVGFVDHVSDTRGWDSLNLYDSFPDAFVAQLEAI